MKTILIYLKRTLMFALMFLAINVFAQNYQTKHEVQRGETFASIASQYGISEKMLKQMNPLCDNCYVGLTLLIQQDRTSTIKDKPVENNEARMFMSPEHEEAILLAAGGEYKEAVKKYTQLLEKESRADFYMSRGICQFERHKWKKAISDLEVSLNMEGLSEDSRKEAEMYLKKAKKERRIQLENRANLWSGIAAMALVTTATVIQASNTNNNPQTSQASTVSKTNDDFSDNTNEEKTVNTIKEKSECPICHGAGKIVEYASNFGISDEKYCEECGKMVIAGHYHKTCSYCSGKGYK